MTLIRSAGWIKLFVSKDEYSILHRAAFSSSRLPGVIIYGGRPGSCKQLDASRQFQVRTAAFFFFLPPERHAFLSCAANITLATQMAVLFPNSIHPWFCTSLRFWSAYPHHWVSLGQFKGAQFSGIKVLISDSSGPQWGCLGQKRPVKPSSIFESSIELSSWWCGKIVGAVRSQDSGEEQWTTDSVVDTDSKVNHSSISDERTIDTTP